MENNTDIKYKVFFSKYPFNHDSLVNKEVIYEGLIVNCKHEILDSIKDLSKYKYIRIWKKAESQSFLTSGEK